MTDNSDSHPPKAPITLWKFIGLMIIFAFVAVALFGGFIYVFVAGAPNRVATIAIFIGISGLFAWLLKLISDAASNLSRAWFSEDTDERD